MIEKDIILKSEQDAVRFNGIVTKYPYDVDMALGRYIIDAKSILGVLGMGLGKKTKLRMNTDNADDLIEELALYLCKED